MNSGYYYPDMSTTTFSAGNFSVPKNLAICFAVGLISAFLAGAVGIFILVPIVQLALIFFDQRKYFYFSIITFSFVQFFSKPAWDKLLPPQTMAFLQVNPANSAYSLNYDESFTGTAILLLVYNFLVKKNDASLYRKLFILLFLSAFWIMLSGLGNSIPLGISFNYLSTYLRFPIILLAFLSVNTWNPKELSKIFNFVVLICFHAQVVFGGLQNLSSLVGGQLFLVDGLTGTFNYPVGDWSCMLVGLGMFYFLTRSLLEYRHIHLISYFAGLLYLISASQNLATAVVLTASALLVVWISLYYRSNHKSKSKIVALVFVVVLVIGQFIYTGIQLMVSAGETGTLDYVDTKMYQYEYVVGTAPKILTYMNLMKLFNEENVNLLLGAGPAQYLSGLAMYSYGGPLTQKYNTTEQVGQYMNDLIGRGDYMENNVVAFIGELGIVGFGLMYAMYLYPVWLLLRSVSRSGNIEIIITKIGIAFSVIFMLVYSSLLLVLEVQPMIFLTAILSGIGIRLIEQENNEVSEMNYAYLEQSTEGQLN